MTSDVSVTIDVRVHNPEELWAAAMAHLTGAGIDTDDAESALGTKTEIDEGACLRILLDPGESPPGCTIEESYSNG